MGKRGPKPKYLVSTEWNPGLAYAVGLLASDGSLSCDGRHIDLTSIDIDQLENFNKALEQKDEWIEENRSLIHNQIGLIYVLKKVVWIDVES